MTSDNVPEGTLRLTAAWEHKFNNVTPIAVERMIGGEWVRAGYAAGGPFDFNIVSLGEWRSAAAAEVA